MKSLSSQIFESFSEHAKGGGEMSTQPVGKPGGGKPGGGKPGGGKPGGGGGSRPPRPPPPPPTPPPPPPPHNHRHRRPSPRIQYIGYNRPTWRDRFPLFRNRVIVDRQVPVPVPVVQRVESPTNVNLYYIIIALIVAFIVIFALMKHYN